MNENKTMNQTNPEQASENEEIFSLKSFIEPIVVGLIIAAIVLSLIRITKVYGESMSPTLDNHQYLVISKVAYFVGTPERQEIAVVRNNTESGHKNWIKRVIGIPGDKIEIRNHVLYLNDKPLKEKYIKEPMIQETMSPIVLEDKEYFICGDNRNNSMDSRTIGVIKENQFIGKVVFDLSHFKFVKN